MTSWDRDNKQILSSLCINCSDKRFTPLFPDMENVGCCRYEPVFTLFEINKMVQDGREDFFLREIYSREDNTIFPFEIMVHAKIDERFEHSTIQEKYARLLASRHTRYQAMELRTRYAVCSFFVSGRGCGLNPLYKTSICRSFVCESILHHGGPQERASIQRWQSDIHLECDEFNRLAQRQLEKLGINLLDHVEQVIAYLKGWDPVELSRTVKNQ